MPHDSRVRAKLRLLMTVSDKVKNTLAAIAEREANS